MFFDLLVILQCQSRSGEMQEARPQIPLLHHRQCETTDVFSTSSLYLYSLKSLQEGVAMLAVSLSVFERNYVIMTDLHKLSQAEQILLSLRWWKKTERLKERSFLWGGEGKSL